MEDSDLSLRNSLTSPIMMNLMLPINELSVEICLETASAMTHIPTATFESLVKVARSVLGCLPFLVIDLAARIITLKVMFCSNRHMHLVDKGVETKRLLANSMELSLICKNLPISRE
jgi:hypothetical protein